MASLQPVQVDTRPSVEAVFMVPPSMPSFVVVEASPASPSAPDTWRWSEIKPGRAELGDARRTKRLIELALQRGAQPQASIPQACGNRAATKAAYRFYENNAVADHVILRSHQQATLDRIAQAWRLFHPLAASFNWPSASAVAGAPRLGDSSTPWRPPRRLWVMISLEHEVSRMGKKEESQPVGVWAQA